tara:strand:- start:95 stop:601 length:507 start_codon:yes stop_codon:yes gene_type:complete
MSSCFSNRSNEKLSSKQYTELKKNEALFCDLTNSNSNIHKIDNNNRLIKSVNHENLISLTKGFHHYYQNKVINNDLFLNEINEEEFTENKCVKHASSNVDTSNNYIYGASLQTHFDNGYQQVSDDGIIVYNEYADIKKEDIAGNDEFTNNKKVLKRKCFRLHRSISKN